MEQYFIKIIAFIKLTIINDENKTKFLFKSLITQIHKIYKGTCAKL